MTMAAEFSDALGALGALRTNHFGYYDAVVDAFDRINELHVPVAVEVEVFIHDDNGINKLHAERFPECDDDNECPGHTIEIMSCVECGERGDVDGTVVYFEWPCRTARALGAD